MKGWERSFFSYSFVAPGKSNDSPPRSETFRGQDAIGLPEIPKNLRGKLYERTLRSLFLTEDRKVSVYIPPGTRRHSVPVLFMADGQSIADFARAIFGFSSGAAFAAAAALQHPEVFGNALPFSIGFPQLPEKPKGPLPHFYFVAGELEPAFLAGTRTVREIVAGWGADATLNVFMSGHDQLMWQVGLVESIPRVFPAQRR